MTDSDETSLVASPQTALANRGGWRGDEHNLQVAAAREAGLPADEVALGLYTEGFKTAMVLRDPDDAAMVVRGRTVLKVDQLHRALRPMLQFLELSPEYIRLRVRDGGFELRINDRMADAQTPALDAAKDVFKVWLAAGLVGFAILQIPSIGIVGSILSLLIWMAGLLWGGFALRRGMVSGRARLGARLALGLGMLAQEEQLILPAKSEEST